MEPLTFNKSYLFEMKTSGAYYIDVKYKPKNFFVKILNALGIFMPERPVLDYDRGPIGVDIQLGSVNKDGYLFVSDLFMMNRSEKAKIQIGIPRNTAENFEVDVKVERVIS